ncbi:MAG: energy transducer TonB, partial [Flavobacteriales bacterium]|nr:energy transducer TonB [Flavobacteriales bacterium]
MKKLIILTIALLPLLSMGQGKGYKKIMNTDSLGYNEEFYVMKKTPGVKHGEYQKQSKRSGIAFEKGFFKNGKRDGKWTIKLQGNSRVYSTGKYIAGKKVGQWSYYYDGKVDQIYDHTANKVITSKREAGKLDYIGGKTLIRVFVEETLVYNESAKKRGIKGKVYISFDVNEKGEVYNVIIIKGVHDLLNIEA